MEERGFMYYLKVFYPLIIITIGVVLLLLSGVNDMIGRNIFQAMKYVAWYGWIGIVMLVGGTIWMLIKNN